MSNHYQFRRQRQSAMSEMNVVPYIDVMLVLLVIFMVTAPMLTQGIEVDLPDSQADALALNDQQPIIISLTAKGEIWLQHTHQDRVRVSQANLSNEVKALQNAQSTPVPVLVNGDQVTPYGRIIELMSALQAAGVKEVGLLTELPANQP